MEETHGTLKKSIITEGVVLATVPIIAYYSAYQYEVGYYRAFGAPENLISVDISTLIAFGSGALGIIYFLYVITDALWPSRLDKLSEMPWRKTFLYLLLTFICWWILLYHIFESGWVKSLLIPAYFVLLLFFYRLFGKSNAYPKWILVLLILVSLLETISQGIGGHNARTQRRFTVIESETNTFVIRKLGDNFLCSTYDPCSRTYVKHFQLIPIKDEGLSLEYKDIGPLRSSP
jgi:hypothetical protein